MCEFSAKYNNSKCYVRLLVHYNIVKGRTKISAIVLEGAKCKSWITREDSKTCSYVSVRYVRPVSYVFE
jgi:hypothetical protein